MTVRSRISLAGALLSAAVAGCASDSSWLESAMIVPGYYDTLECRDLTAQVAWQAARIKEVTDLVEKSGHGVAGSVANVMAYQTDLAKAHAAHDAAERAAKRKGCDQTDKPAAAATAPGKPAQVNGMPPRH
jgi:hypothetical protein